MKPTYNCKRVMVLHLRAPNDTNGNPRRVYVVFAPSPTTGRTVLVDSFDEGYSGDASWRRHFTRDACETSSMLTIEVPVSEYHAWASGRDATSDDSPFVDPVPVMFRTGWKHGTNCQREAVFAVFPSLMGVDKPESVTTYEHVGQHSSGDYSFMVSKSRPATEEEYGPLKKELERIGYRLRVVRNGYVFAWWRDRKEEIRKMRARRLPVVKCAKCGGVMQDTEHVADDGTGECCIPHRIGKPPEECAHGSTRLLVDEDKSWREGEEPITVCTDCGEEVPTPKKGG